MIPFATSIRYMIAAYAAIATILTAYLIGLFLRWRRLNHDLRALEDQQRSSKEPDQ